MSESTFQEHRIMLCLNKELYSGFIKLQADRGLGRSYAGLLPFVEGLHKMGYLSKENYDMFLKRYSQPLVKAKPPTKEELENQVKQKELEAQFLGVLNTGLEKLSEKARNYWIQKARENPEVPNARRILDLANSGKGEDPS